MQGPTPVDSRLVPRCATSAVASSKMPVPPATRHGASSEADRVMVPRGASDVRWWFQFRRRVEEAMAIRVG